MNGLASRKLQWWSVKHNTQARNNHASCIQQTKRQQQIHQTQSVSHLLKIVGKTAWGES